MPSESIRVYGLVNCDTVKKARAWLDANGIRYEFVDFKRTPPERAHVARWMAAIGGERLVNRRGTTWRKLPASEQAAAATDAGAIEVLLAHPSAIRRPVIEHGASVSAGFDEEVFRGIFGS